MSNVYNRSNQWVIRREHIVEDFHQCVSNYLISDRNKRRIIISIKDEKGVDKGANISILNAYFASISSNKCLFEMHNALGTLPRRVLSSKNLKTLKLFGYIVHLAWIWHRLVPTQFHVSVVLFACCNFNAVENHINSMHLSTLRNSIKQAGIYFPKTFQNWNASPDTVQLLCQTYFLEHLIDNNLEQNAIKTHYDWFSAQAIKYILLGFRHLSFQHISLGGNDHVFNRTSDTQESLIKKIVYQCRLAQAKQKMLHIEYVVTHENNINDRLRFICEERNKQTLQRGTEKESISILDNELGAEDDDEHILKIKKYFNMFILAVLKLQKEEENFTVKFLNFATSSRYIKDPITIQISTRKQLPKSNTCVNRIILWEGYTSKEELIADLKIAIEWSGDHLLCL